MSKKLLMNTNDSSLTDSFRCYDKEFTGSFITASDISPTNYIDTETIVETKNMREITEIWGNTTQDENDLSNIQSLGWWNESRKCYEFDILSSNDNLINLKDLDLSITKGTGVYKATIDNNIIDITRTGGYGAGELISSNKIYLSGNMFSKFIYNGGDAYFKKYIRLYKNTSSTHNYEINFTNAVNVESGYYHIGFLLNDTSTKISEISLSSSVITSYIVPQSNKTTISLPCQLQKVGNVADRLYWDGVKGRYIVEKKTSFTTRNSTNSYRVADNTKSNVLILECVDIVSDVIQPNPDGGINTISYPIKSADVGNWNRDEEGIQFMNGGSRIRIHINRNKLDTEDVEGFKKYLLNNNDELGVYYILQTSQLIETSITSKIQLPTYLGTTHTFITDDTTDASKFTYEDKDVDILVGARPIEIFGNTIQDETDLSKIESLGVWNERRQGYEIDILSASANLIDKALFEKYTNSEGKTSYYEFVQEIAKSNISSNIEYKLKRSSGSPNVQVLYYVLDKDKKPIVSEYFYNDNIEYTIKKKPANGKYIKFVIRCKGNDIQYSQDLDIYFNEGYDLRVYVGNDMGYAPHQSNKTTILLPCQLQKVGNVADRLYWDSVKSKYVVEKKVFSKILDGSNDETYVVSNTQNPSLKRFKYTNRTFENIGSQFISNYTKSATFISVYEKPIFSVEGDKGLYIISNDRDANTDEFRIGLSNSNFKMYYTNNTPQLIETNITEKIKVPTYANKTHISFVSENGIDCSDSKVLVPYKELL